MGKKSKNTPDEQALQLDRETECEHAGVLFSTTDDPMNTVRKRLYQRIATECNADKADPVKRASSMDEIQYTTKDKKVRKSRMLSSKKWSRMNVTVISLLLLIVISLAIQNREIIRDNKSMSEAYKHLDKAVADLDPYAFYSQTTAQIKSLASVFDMGFIFDEITPVDIDQNEPSLIYKNEGWKPKHPIYIFPGFTTNGLILWKGGDCAKSWFRRRIWGHYSMAQSIAGDKDCWMEHMSLNEETGLDPDHIKVRPVTGLQGIDTFLPIYHVWLPLIEGLGRFGYDSSNMVTGNNDWRIAPGGAQTRDSAFLTYLAEIELLVQKTGEKAILVNHSHGDIMTKSFIRWVEQRQLDGTDPRYREWVNRHVKSVFSVGAPMLGVPKATSALVNGEFRDTAEMTAATKMMSDVLVTTTARAKLWRTWSALRSMIPHRDAPSHIPSLIIKRNDINENDLHLSINDILDHLDVLEGGSPDLLFDRYSDSKDRVEFDYLRDPLTLDPDTELDFFVYYGTGIETEQGYIVDEINPIVPPEHHHIATHISDDCYIKDAFGKCIKVFKGLLMDPNGDGTVTHVSNGYVARNLWHDHPLTPDDNGTVAGAPTSSPTLNPNNMRVVVKELEQKKHKTDTSLQYVADAGNHVDVLGNWIFLDDLINEASGRAAVLNDTTHLKHAILREAEYLPPRALTKQIRDEL